MTRDDIDKLDGLYQQTSSGEWLSDKDTVYGDAVHAKFCDTFVFSNGDCAKENVTWIAALHNAWPAIREELARLQAQNERLKRRAEFCDCASVYDYEDLMPEDT